VRNTKKKYVIFGELNVSNVMQNGAQCNLKWFVLSYNFCLSFVCLYIVCQLRPTANCKRVFVFAVTSVSICCLFLSVRFLLTYSSLCVAGMSANKEIPQKQSINHDHRPVINYNVPTFVMYRAIEIG